mgnify:CR=1 FL=1
MEEINNKKLKKIHINTLNKKRNTNMIIQIHYI